MYGNGLTRRPRGGRGVGEAREAALRARILVVEDDADIATVLALLVRAAGHEPVSAGDLSAARRRFAAEPLHLVILDVLLPDGSGLDFCREVKAARPSLPIVVLTAAWHDEAARRQVLDVCADRFVTKPFDPDELDGVLKALLPNGNAPMAPRAGP